MTNLLFIDKTPSTNQYLLKQLAEIGAESGTAIVTFNQSKGRGQKGNEWISEPEKNILYSIVIKPDFIPARNQFLLSEFVSLTVKALLDEHTKDITIKWPNDIYYKNSKIGGILIENKLEGSLISHSVIGIGLNINQTDFPAELPNPVSLSQITGYTYDLKELTEKLHHRLVSAFGHLSTENESDIRKYYLNSLYRRDGFHLYKDSTETFKARILDINAHGHLILEPEEGAAREYDFKEVVFL
ncbi:MAG TPA: biotin--[acetyl-CoA-carboxylase] ligase [Bacteroidales bacterium]|nr:biotin--[acetyl-CoA-carboxylase] ligase [Bacteroidales bacterium]